MSLYVFDTDTLVLIHEGHKLVGSRVVSHPIDGLATTAITVEEELSGWYTLLRRVKDRKQLARAYQRLVDAVRLCARFHILSFTEAAIDRFERLKTLKLGVKHNDLRIAAIVVEHGGTLVTRNTRDFRDIPGLAIVDWSSWRCTAFTLAT
jgi:tRNA(fMet)-specific endonuclease VapC